MNHRNAFLSCAVILGYMQQNAESVGSVAETEAEVNSLLGMEDLESMSFDELEENPGFVNPPNGVYILGLTKADMKTRKNRKGEMQRNLNHIYKILKTEELADPNEKAPTDGALFSERWQVTTEGLSYWKPRAKAIIGDDSTGGLTIGNMVKLLNDGNFTFKAKVNQRESTGDDGRKYINMNVQVIEKMPDFPEGQI